MGCIFPLRIQGRNGLYLSPPNVGGVRGGIGYLKLNSTKNMAFISHIFLCYYAGLDKVSYLWYSM
jgi:hypothetical protein